MLSEIVAAFFQDVLKDRFRGFAIWLYGSEITVALLFAVFFLGIEPVGTAVLLAYAALTFATLRRQLRKFDQRATSPPRVRTAADDNKTLTAILIGLIVLAAALIWPIVSYEEPSIEEYEYDSDFGIGHQ